MYEEFESKFVQKDKFLNCYLNGNSDIVFSIKLQKLSSLKKEISKKFNFSDENKLRLFT